MNKNTSVLSIAIITLFFSCSTSDYINIEEVPEIEFTSRNSIPQNHQSFTNETSQQKVSILHRVGNTGVHYYNSFKFITENIGVLAGGAGLRTRITQNGGESWKEFSFSKFANAFHSVAFSGSTLFIVGESKYIFRSNDFGNSWSVYNSELLIDQENMFSQFKFYKIRFIDDQVGFIVGEQNDTPVILKTQDSGEHWSIVDTKDSLKDSGVLTDFHIHSAENITIVTSTGECYNTDDNGKTWKLLLKTNPLNSIAFKNENNGYIGGINGTLYYTDNGGKDWRTIEVPEKPNISDILFVNNKTLITTSISFSDARAVFVYEIDQSGKVLLPYLTKTNEDVQFMGDSYAIDFLENHVYILDRNNLYKTAVE